MAPCRTPDPPQDGGHVVTATPDQVAALAPLAAVIHNTIRVTPVHLDGDGAAELASRILAAVATHMGQELGPDAGILGEIVAERSRQDAKWGQQDHPAIDHRDIPDVTHHHYGHRADLWKSYNAERAIGVEPGSRCPRNIDGPHKHTAWDGVLLEEVYEALGEADPDRMRAELVQVAATTVAWIAAIDRRTASGEAS